jgi:hypothetical protein
LYAGKKAEMLGRLIYTLLCILRVILRNRRRVRLSRAPAARVNAAATRRQVAGPTAPRRAIVDIL